MTLRVARVALVVTIVLLVGACSTAGRIDVAPPTTAAEPGARTAVPARRGAYYLDDGPGENAPVDVASVPDAVPRAEPLLPGTLRPYSVFGRQYTPMTALAPYRMRGTASWYGRRYHGQPTSSGERYDMYAMSAAHPTLPLPSYVRVTRVADGRSVVVRVNDRGPFLQNRLIDLSYTAAAKLGFVEDGSAEVDVELITQFDPSPATAVAAQGAALQSDNAEAPRSLTVETTYAAEPRAARSSSADPAQAVAPQPQPQQSTGTADAALPSLRAAPDDVADARPAKGFWLQFGAFGSLDSARSAMQALAREMAWIGAPFDVHSDGALHKVQAGPWPRRDHASAAAERVRNTTAHRPFAVFR